MKYTGWCQNDLNVHFGYHQEYSGCVQRCFRAGLCLYRLLAIPLATLALALAVR